MGRFRWIGCNVGCWRLWEYYCSLAIIAARIMTPEWWEAAGDRNACEALQDDLIHDMGDVTHMLPNAEGADLFTSIKEVKPFIEQRIVESLTASRHERLAGAMMHLIHGGGKRMRATLPWLVGRAVGIHTLDFLILELRLKLFTILHSSMTILWIMTKFGEVVMLFTSNTICLRQSTQEMPCLQLHLSGSSCQQILTYRISLHSSIELLGWFSAFWRPAVGYRIWKSRTSNWRRVPWDDWR